MIVEFRPNWDGSLMMVRMRVEVKNMYELSYKLKWSHCMCIVVFECRRHRSGPW